LEKGIIFLNAIARGLVDIVSEKGIKSKKIIILRWNFFYWNKCWNMPHKIKFLSQQSIYKNTISTCSKFYNFIRKTTEKHRQECGSSCRSQVFPILEKDAQYQWPVLIDLR
jgi:hypothetical protein